MKVFISFILFLIAALVVGALLSYPVHQLISLFTEIPLEKLVNKVSKLVAIAGIVPFLAIYALNSWQAAGLNISKREFWREYFVGLGIGIATLCILTGMIMLLDIRVIDNAYEFNIINLIKTLAIGLVIGTLVAFIEEIFFRGVMMTGISRTTSLLGAAFLTATLYAGIHFIKSKGVALEGSVGFFSGLEVLQQMANKIFLAKNLDSFLALMTVGLFLALVRVNKQHIAQNIGIHAGWVMVIKFTKDITNSNDSAELSYLVGDYDGIIGWLGFGYLSLLCLGYYLFVLRPKINGVQSK